MKGTINFDYITIEYCSLKETLQQVQINYNL